MFQIAIIINSFNRLSLLKIALDALENWLPLSVYSNKIFAVVYDAGSTDGTIAWIQNGASYSFPIHLITARAGEDSSFAAGLNSGVNFAIHKSPNLEYLLFYETDNQILSEQALIAAEQELKVDVTLGACGFTVRYVDGKSAGTGMPFPKLLNFLVGKNIIHLLNLEAIPFKWLKRVGTHSFSYVDVVYTSPLLVKIHAWRESKGLDSSTFPFSDCDIDWAKRLRMLGWRMGVIRTNDVIHDNQTSTSEWSAKRALNFHKARLLYFKRFNPFLIYLIWPLPLMFRHFLEWIACIAIKDEIRKRNLRTQFRELLKKCVNSYN